MKKTERAAKIMNNNNNRLKYNLIALASIILLIALDQWTKALAVDKLMNKEPFIIIENVLQFKYLENRGAAFGLFQNKQIFFFVFGVILLGFIAYAYYKMPLGRKYTLLRVTAALMAAGAIGNMIDRVLNNYVVDFVYFELINFPIFNVADCYVTIAAALIIVSFSFVYKEEDFKFLELKKN